MASLTEHMIMARTKQSDLSHIKKLNCWGCDLIDVSIISTMPCLEVLSLSVNKINSLKYFAPCKKLQELYLRKNNIRDIEEIRYLKGLPLRYLWLEENPFCVAVGAKYRATILKALPHLEKLDNIDVTDAERHKALQTDRSDIEDSRTRVDERVKQLYFLAQKEKHENLEQCPQSRNQQQSSSYEKQLRPYEYRPLTHQEHNPQLSNYGPHRNPPYNYDKDERQRVFTNGDNKECTYNVVRSVQNQRQYANTTTQTTEELYLPTHSTVYCSQYECRTDGKPSWEECGPLLSTARSLSSYESITGNSSAFYVNETPRESNGRTTDRASTRSRNSENFIDGDGTKHLQINENTKSEKPQDNIVRAVLCLLKHLGPEHLKIIEHSSRKLIKEMNRQQD